MYSNGYFWPYTIALIIVWIIVLATAIEKEDNEGENIKNCKTLCKQCGCLDFYCGEECICECNNDRSDTQCIAIMQTKARTMNTPFEILIQGPTANNFVRNALKFEQNTERLRNGYRYRRSTITIYMPNKDRITPKHGSLSIKNSIGKESFKSKERTKRSTDNTDNWFSGITNNLVRPAPLGIRKNQNENDDDYEIPQFKDTERFMKPLTFDNSWFLDDTPNILTPAPIFKQKLSKSSSVLYKESPIQSNEINENNPLPLSLYNEGTFHQLTTNDFDRITDIEKDKINSNEFGKSSVEAIQMNSLENKEFKDSQETLSSGLQRGLFKDDTNKFQEVLTTKHAKPKRIHWLKPIDFLEKLRRLLIA